mgnify:CR=1 FL=1
MVRARPEPESLETAPARRTSPTEPGKRQRPLSTWTDDALFDEVAKGSEPHFTVLYERYFQRIYAFVYLRLRNHADAEEVTQETFTVVFRSAGDWGGKASPLAWTYGIAKNTVANHQRRAHAGRQRLEQAGPTPLVTTSPTWSFTPEEHLDLTRCAERMQRELTGLADWQAQAFVLRHAHNCSIPEISERTGRSSDAVRSGLYRVKKMLLEVGAEELSQGGNG